MCYCLTSRAFFTASATAVALSGEGAAQRAARAAAAICGEVAEESDRCLAFVVNAGCAFQSPDGARNPKFGAAAKA